MGDITNMLSGVLPETAPKLDIMGTLTAQVMNLIPAELMAFYNANKVICLFAAMCILMLLAVQGYKLFKMLLYSGSAFLFAYLGFKFLAPQVTEAVVGLVPETIQVDVLVAIFCALFAVFLTRCAYSFMLMILGTVAGYFLGSSVIYNTMIKHFHTLTFLQNDIVKHVIGGIIGVIFAVLFILMFKHLFMVLTSFGCSVGSALILQTLLMPAADSTIKVAFAILGFVIGIYCVVRQYRDEEKDLEIVF